MFFLVRCIFWLGVLFMALPWDGASVRADLSEHAEQATRAIAREAQEVCAKDPIGCAAQAMAIGKAFDAAPSQNTLKPADVVHGWRGPSTLATSRRPPG